MTAIRQISRHRRFLTVLGVFCVLGLASLDARALDPWTPKQQMVAGRIQSGLRAMNQFTDAFEKARPPVNVKAKGPIAVKKFAERLKAMSTSYRKSFGKLKGPQSIGQRLRRIRQMKDASERHKALRAFSQFLLSKHRAGVPRMYAFVKDSPDNGAIRNFSRMAEGKFAEAAQFSKGL